MRALEYKYPGTSFAATEFVPIIELMAYMRFRCRQDARRLPSGRGACDGAVVL